MLRAALLLLALVLAGCAAPEPAFDLESGLYGQRSSLGFQPIVDAGYLEELRAKEEIVGRAALSDQERLVLDHAVIW